MNLKIQNFHINTRRIMMIITIIIIIIITIMDNFFVSLQLQYYLITPVDRYIDISVYKIGGKKIDFATCYRYVVLHCFYHKLNYLSV